MAERCLMAASLAVLVFHPSSTIKWFKPKSSATSPPKERHPPPPPPPPPPSKPSRPRVKKVSSKSKKKQDLRANTPLSMTSSQSNTNKPPPRPPILKTGKLFNPFSELVKGEPSIGVVETIFRSGWLDKALTIDKILQVNHSIDVLNRFEEYREMVKSKAPETSVGRRMERLIVDGNELLRFYGAVITCPIGYKGVSNICNKKCCGVCRMIGSNVSMKAGCSLSLCEKSWRAHEKVTTECLVNGVSARKAILLCRVIAGRVAHFHEHEHGIVDGEGGGFDSVVSSTGDQSHSSEELIVFNPGAVLPCFVVIYIAP